jgi:hypothetical protein
MKAPRLLFSLAGVAVLAVGPSLIAGNTPLQERPQVKIPESGVPQIATIEGTFVRAAYNNEGYAIIGYKLANLSVGEEWMLLEFGTTVLDRTPNYTLKREALSLDTPDGKTIPLAAVDDYREANLAALQNRERVARDSINYFPPSASQACRIGFFSELANRARSYDQVELSNTRGCVGRLFFKVPGGIQYGQHWLNVKFEKSLVRVPFRILTKDEEKLLNKNYGSIRKQVQEAFKPKKKS